MTKQIHLAAHFPGVNNTTVWSDPTSGSQTDFASFVHLAQTAERGKFDFFFLAEGLRLREHRGRIFDLDVVGRPDSLTVLAALAAVTDRLGLAATLNTTFNEPFELARQFATLDHLSGGRAAWNAVTSPDAFTGENFRRGGFLDPALRYDPRRGVHRRRPGVVGQLGDDAVVADAERACSCRTPPWPVRAQRRRVPDPGRVRRAPQPAGLPRADPGRRLRRRARAGGRPGRRHLQPPRGLARRAGVLRRREGAPRPLRAPPRRSEDHPGRRRWCSATPRPTPTSGPRHLRQQQVSPQGAIAFLEQVWGRDLSGYDPDGPLPDVDPDPDGGGDHARSGAPRAGSAAVAAKWRALAEEKR